MHEASLIIARPQVSDQLVLLFHGVGSCAADLASLGEAIAQARPQATVVSVEAPHPSKLGRGKEWFSVLAVTEENRPQRIAEAMPQFLQTIAHWQKVTGMGPERTVLVGFSQGAIMSLESTQTTLAPTPPAQTLIAIAGRLAEVVQRAPAGVHFHLIHGDQDGVVMTRWSVEAEQQLRALGGAVTLDLVPGLGHGIDGRVLGLVAKHLPQF